MSKFTLRQSGSRVDLVVDGALISEMPWQKALEIANGLLQQAKRAEEWDKAQQIAEDQAILIRSGAPIGLTSNPVINDEAAKIAAWDSNLRRYMPGGVRSQSIVGSPTIIQGQPGEMK